LAVDDEAEQAAEEIDKTVDQLDKLKEQLQRLNEDNEEQSKSEEENTIETSEGEGEERISFFPSRREIVVDQPQGDTRGILSKSSHLVDSTGEAYMYKISPEDIWNTPYDSFNDLRSDLKSVVDEDWDDGFESRILDDWNHAHQFTLVTREQDSGEPFSVLKAQDPEVFEDVAKRKLEYGTHYTEFLSDTEMRIKRGGEADVKEKLYDEGYPVIDKRQLDEGDSLDIELVEDINLRDYQKDWVDHFTERKAGVFVGPSGSGKTVAAIGAMTAINGETLILVPNRELAQQWKQELTEKTNLSPRKIGEYHGGKKQLRPVTIATYDTAAMTRHRKLFNKRKWGLVVADECLSGDTEIVTEKGRTTFNEIDDELGLEEGWTEDVDLSVQTFDEENGEYHFTSVSGIYKDHKKVQEISTQNGRSLRATPNHTHLIFDPETCSVKETEELSEGDYLIYPHEPDQRAYEADDPAAELTGWAIGDGSRTEDDALKFSFAKRAQKQVDIISELCESLDVEYSTYGNSRGDLTIRARKPFSEIPYSGPVGAKTNSIRVPAESYTWEKGRIAALLRGVFDAEGWADSESGRVQIGVTSEGLADDLIFLFQRLGFEPRKMSLDREEPHSDMYRVYLPKNECKLFLDRIGTRMPHKRENIKGGSTTGGFPAYDLFGNLKEDLNLYGREVREMIDDSICVNKCIRETWDTSRERLLELAEGLEELVEESPDNDLKLLRNHWNIPYSEISEESGVDMSYSRKLLLDELDAPETTEKVENALKSIAEDRKSTALEYVEKLGLLANFGVTEVTEIETQEEEAVYDLETESHTFLADGFLTHNCHHAVAETWKRFRSIQSTARLGLSATPVRESGDAKEIYTLIGPPVGTDWGKLFSEGWVAKPDVDVIKVPWASDNARERYRSSERSQKMIEAAKNRTKLEAIKRLLNRHSNEKALIFVDWIDQGTLFADELGLPFIYGETSHRKRDEIYEDFRDGEIDSLIISRVGDEGIDLPDAEVAILASTLGSSRSQTGQRAGRTMRPLGDSQVYILLTKGSGEADWGRESTQYLAEKGIDVSTSSFKELKATASDSG